MCKVLIEECNGLKKEVDLLCLAIIESLRIKNMEQTKSKVGAFKIVGNWEEQSKMLTEKFPELTDTDLKFETGKEFELLARIETRLNKKRAAVIKIIKNGQLEKA
jgi:hypothetical protein